MQTVGHSLNERNNKNNLSHLKAGGISDSFCSQQPGGLFWHHLCEALLWYVFV